MVLVFSYVSVATTIVPPSEPITEVSGQVLDVDGEPLAGVNIRVKDKLIGTTTDGNGMFSISIKQDPPLVLVFSIVGFRSQEVDITNANTSGLEIRLEEQTILGEEVVVSASRLEENILESPVSIEKMDVLEIQNTASPSFYDAIGNLKGVDFSTQSLTFKSINSRGFGANGNTRFVQLIDGIDNQAPGLNFAVGNIVGISELDLESAELIPGAASALYGPNALNGILLMNSKSPFEYKGLSFNTKLGVNHIDSQVESDPQLYQSYDLRYADSYNDKFAFKITASYLKAQDFVGQDYRDQSGLLERGASSRSEALVPRLYDGLNTYGDFTITTGIVADAAIAQGSATAAATRSLVPDGADGAFTPTGYRENSFVDNTTESLKFGGGINYRINDEYEILAQYNTGFGSTVYTANDRFVLDDFNIWTAKVELKNPNFYLRAYTTQEDAGDSYAANTLASLVNQQLYLPNYLEGFITARLAGQNYEESHASARVYADDLQPTPDDQAFKDAAEQIRNTPISDGGAKFLDKSDLYHAEGFYNFSNMIDPSNVQLVGGVNVRRYALESEGTLFAYKDIAAKEEYNIDEWGAFVQAGKNVLDGNLDLSASIRYDKNEYFDGQFSPRASAILTVADVHNLRASVQRGFRIPTTQDQFIDLDVVSRRLIGSNPDLVDRYRFESNPVYTGVTDARNILAAGGSAADALAQVEVFDFEDFEPEKLTTFEVGYKSLIGGRLFIDAYYYFSNYTDFIAEVTFTQGIPNGLTAEPDPSEYNGNTAPGTDAWVQSIVTQQDPNDSDDSFATQSYGFDINADGNVRSHGFAITTDYSLNGGYTIGGNVSYNNLLDQDDLIRQGFRASYNTPEWRYNLKFQNRNVVENVGFNLVYRWQDAYVWESSIGEGVVPAFGTLDAQISYKLSDFNTIVKLGGSNILNERYTTSLANPRLGAIYYVSFTFDQFLN
jgi:outer membrane receptor protein involved in Fe transport